MKKLSIIISFIGICFKNLKSVLQLLMHYTIEEKKKELLRKKGYKKGLATVDILDLVPSLDIEINHLTFLDGTSRLPDMVLLKSLAKKFNNCEYLEIGSWRGESLINVACVAKHCTSLSLSKEEMRQMGMDERVIALEGFLTNKLTNVTFIGHNSQTFDFSTLKTKYDLIFVDGDHNYASVVNDTRNVFKLLKDENSIIVWHDCGHAYEDFRWEVIAAILEGAPAEARKHIYRISNSLCGIYINKEVNSKFFPTFRVPDKLFTVSIKSAKLNLY